MPDWELITDENGNPITINWDQSYAIWRAIDIWRKVAIEFGGEHYEYLKDSPPRLVDMEKSCLLGRMTMEGKPPLPEPPPTCFSAPWYNLIEDGHAHLWLNEFTVYGPYDDQSDFERIINIGQRKWFVFAEDERGILCKYKRDGDLWRLRKLEPEERTVAGGQNYQTGATLYYDGILERVV